ncbi:MAG: sigma-E processing peptidase SpoIIGA [Clostridia bacterium]|nr:sigma-E processing peptidase SpoIIGA [Clostridia bacterium]
MSVYLDLAFFLNFVFDAELIIMTHLICSKKIRPFRVFLAAFLGGMQGVLVFFPYFGILSLPPVSILVSVLMTTAAICPCKKRDFFTFYIIFLGASFFLAGIITFAKTRLLLGSLLIIPLYGVIEKIKKEIFLKRSTVTLCYKDRKIEKTALYDSGNAVFYLGKPVIMANRKLLCDFFGKDFAQRDLESSEDVCIIPYKAVGKSGTVIGIRLDAAIVNGKSYCGAVLGFFDESLNDEIILNRTMT